MRLKELLETMDKTELYISDFDTGETLASVSVSGNPKDFFAERDKLRELEAKDEYIVRKVRLISGRSNAFIAIEVWKEGD